jgi:hypothetical protein
MKPSMHIKGIQVNKQKKLVLKKILHNLPSLSFPKYITNFPSHNLVMEIMHNHSLIGLYFFHTNVVHLKHV